MNDPKIDAKQVNNFDIGKQMVRLLSEENTNWILNVAGADNGGNFYWGHFQTILETYGAMDFGANF